MKILNFRRTEALDAIFIQEILDADPGFKNIKTNLINLLERSLISITGTNANNEVVGCLILNDSPNITIINGSFTNEWLKVKFGFDNLNTSNTLFMELLTLQAPYRKRGYRALIRTAFAVAHDIHHLLLIIPEEFDLGNEEDLEDGLIDDNFDVSNPFNWMRLIYRRYRETKIKPINVTAHFDSGVQELKYDILHFKREHYFPRLRARPARVQDNDCLYPLFEKYTKTLSKTYGEFYLAELCEAQTDKMKTITVQQYPGGDPVGFVNITSDFDLDFLNEQFNLEPFNRLQKQIDPIIDITDAIDYIEEIPSDSQPGPQVDVPNKKESLSPLKIGEANFVQTPENYNKKFTLTNVVGHISDSSLSRDGLKYLSSVTDSSENIRSAVFSDSESIDIQARFNLICNGNWTRRHLTGSIMGDSSKPNKKSAIFFPEKERNAFIIQLYSIQDDLDMRSIDFLPFMFESLPGYDYAIMSVPRLVPEINLLQHFIRVQPVPNSTVTQELYLFHRANLVRQFEVRPANRDDLDGIMQIMHSMHPFDNHLLTKDLNKYMTFGRDSDDNELICYVATCLTKIVGVLMAKREENIEWLKAHYNIEDYVYFVRHGRHEFVTIIHFLLASSLHMRSRHFLREVMRQAEKTCMFYYIYPPFAMDSSHKLNTLISCLSELYAIKPRTQITFPEWLLKSEKGPALRVLKSKLDNPPPAVYHITRNLVMEPKIVLNARIIIVGASSVNLAFLENICFNSHLRFNNLILLSTYGLPGDTEEEESHRVNQFFPPTYLQDRVRMGQISLRTYVSIIKGKLTAINRKKKHIRVDGKHTMSYDFLILAPGLQYHPPIPVGWNPTNKPVKKPRGPCNTELPKYSRTPSNLFLLNDIESTKHATQYVQNNLLSDKSNAKELKGRPSLTSRILENPNQEERPEMNPEEGPIIVYGLNLQTYACVHGLLEMGVPGLRIIMINPPVPEDEYSFFEDLTVETTIYESMKELNVRVLSNCRLAQWNNEPEEDTVDKITSASFLSGDDRIRLRCVAFFSFVDENVDYDFFTAVNDACLVFDKRLVVDMTFHTSDPCIRAAGPVTKLQRIYYNDKYSHSYCNSVEVGERLAKEMLHQFDPNVKAPKKPVKDEHHLLPVYKMPRVAHAVLPGGFHYLKIWSSGRRKSLKVRSSLEKFGRAIVTGVPESGNGYFYIHTNEYNEVTRIVCLAKHNLVINNYVALFGTHQRALNNLVCRYDEGLIVDLYAYFEEAWAVAFFHDRFPDLKKELHELGCTPKNDDEIPFIERIRRRINSHHEITDEMFENLKKEYVMMGNKYEIEKRIIKYIAHNYDLLPMYAKPDMV